MSTTNRSAMQRILVAAAALVPLAENVRSAMKHRDECYEAFRASNKHEHTAKVLLLNHKNAETAVKNAQIEFCRAWNAVRSIERPDLMVEIASTWQEWPSDWAAETEGVTTDATSTSTDSNETSTSTDSTELRLIEAA